MENIKEVEGKHLANLVRSKTDQVLVIDSRTFCEFNTSHVQSSVNVWSSKIRKKRLQQNGMSVQDYLSSACEVRRSQDLTGQWSEIVVYDQSAPDLAAVPNDSFLYVLLDKLSSVYKNVQLLIGGFLEFQSQFPDCCEDATQKCSPLTSLSQPCLPVANVGPTKIFHFLYLGSQYDANNKQMLMDHHILYELNVSISCPKPDFVQDSHFFRIPVNDNFSEKLLPYFWDAFNFIDKVRESGGSVLVHCLAGISRSATVAIAYVMKHLRLSYDEAYRYVKNRRPTISPNINFVGQLLELDKHMRRAGKLGDPSSAPATFRQNSPYSSSLITRSNSSNSSSLEYAVNRKLSGMSNIIAESSYSEDFSERSSRLSSEERVYSAGMNSSAPGTPVVIDDFRLTSVSSARTFNSGLYRKENNMCTNFGKNLAFREETKQSFCPRIGGIVPRTLSLNLKKPLEVVPASPESAPQSPDETDVISPDMCSSISSRTNILTPTSPNSPSGISHLFRRQLSSSNSGSTSSIRSMLSPSTNNSGCFSPTVIEIRKSPTISENVFEAQYSNVMSNESNLNNNSNQQMYSSTATINVDAPSSDVTDGNEDISSRSVCIIEVNTEAPVTYVDDSSKVPMVIRETEKYATPCNEDYKNCDNNGNSSVNIERDFNNKVNEARHKILVPIRGSSSLHNIIDRPKVLELCAPIYNVKQRNLPVVLGDTSWNSKGSFDMEDPKPVPESDKNSENLVENDAPNADQKKLKNLADLEAASVGDSSDFADTASEFSVMQSDSGVSFQTESSENDSALLPQPIPRCYSSGETHLNTRRLLEDKANADYTTRKSCSHDEVAKSFNFQQKFSNNNNNNSTSPREANSNNGNFSPNWNHRELVRCDSWSTSGFGSELSDWESLQEDVASTHCDDAVGPFEAVFSDVFPGEKVDSFLQVFPELFKDGVDPADESFDGEYSDKKPRHHSFKDNQRWRNRPAPLTRPASLPGVMGKYLAREVSDANVADETGVELRFSSTRIPPPSTLKRASVSSRDSGCGGSIRGSYSSGKFPSDFEAYGVKRNDSGYYSVSDKPVVSGMRGTKNSQVPTDCKLLNKNIPSHIRMKKAPMKPQSLAITPLFSSSKARSATAPNIPPRHPNQAKSPSGQRSSPSRLSPGKSNSPKSPTPPKTLKSPTRRSTSPLKESSSRLQSPKKVPDSPQPRTFGSSTFYLSESEISKDRSSPGKKSFTFSSSDLASAHKIELEETNRKSSSENISSTSSSTSKIPGCKLIKKGLSSSNNSKSSYSFDTETKSSGKSVSCGKFQSTHSKSVSPSPSDKTSNSVTIKRKSSSPSISPCRTSSSVDSESGSSETTCISRSLSRSRETSVESEKSYIFNSSSRRSSNTETSLKANNSTNQENKRERLSRENNKSSCAVDSNLKEKRKSCDFDTSTEDTSKKSVSIKTGVRLAQELLQSMENLVSSELSEIRRCTAELSTKYRLKTAATTQQPSITLVKPKQPSSQFYVFSISAPLTVTPPTVASPSKGADRSCSEPPFAGEEGLYRAQSCPGLPQPLVESLEVQETVSELRSNVPKMRTGIVSTKDKLQNRYSCGTLDTQKITAYSPVCRGGPFESCPDLGTLRSSRFCTSDSSSSSVSSSRSSFSSRLLSVS